MPGMARWLALVTIASWCAACGGGGGGSSPPPTPPPTNISGPTISSIFPGTVTAGSASPTLYIVGTNFVTGSVVAFNGNTRPTTYNSSTLLAVTLPAADIAQAGTFNVTVTNSSTSTSSAAQLTVAPANYTVRFVALPTPTDLAWDATNKVFYVMQSNGNISILEPVSGSVRTIPNPSGGAVHMALSDDNQYLYQYPSAPSGIARLKLPDLTLDLNIATDGPAFDVKVAPGVPHTIAVAESSGPTSLAVYDDAVVRPTTLPSNGPNHGDGLEITWGADSAALFGRDLFDSGNTLYTFSVGSTGAVISNSNLNPVTNGVLNPLGGRGLSFAPSQGLIYARTGIGWTQALNPVGPQWAGRLDFPGLASIDSSTNKAFSVAYDDSGNTVVAAYDLSSNAQIAAISYSETGANDLPQVIRWGSDGLAYFTDVGVTLINGSFVSVPPASNADIPVNQTTIAGQKVIIISQAVNDLVWSNSNQLIYLAIPATAAAHGNTIAGMDPDTGQIMTSQHVNSDPETLTVSPDGQFVYTALTGSGSIQRLKLPSLTPDITMPLGWIPFLGNARVAHSLDVSPSSSHSVAAAIGLDDPTVPASTSEISIYDDAVARPNSASRLGQPYNWVQWGATSSTLYSADGEDTAWALYTFTSDATGIFPNQFYRFAFQGFFQRFHFDKTSGYIFGDEGTVINPATGARIGSVGVAGKVVIDGSINHGWVMTSSPPAETLGSVVLSSFNINTLAITGTITIPNVQGSVSQLIRWGSNGLAFTTNSGLLYIVSGTFAQ